MNGRIRTPSQATAAREAFLRIEKYRSGRIKGKADTDALSGGPWPLLQDDVFYRFEDQHEIPVQRAYLRISDSTVHFPVGPANAADGFPKRRYIVVDIVAVHSCGNFHNLGKEAFDGTHVGIAHAAKRMCAGCLAHGAHMAANGVKKRSGVGMRQFSRHRGAYQAVTPGADARFSSKMLRS